MPRIDALDAMPLLARAAAGETLSLPAKRMAVRFALQELSDRHPGRSVEVRIPFVGAVQIIEGLTHRRGTPPNVVELDADLFLDIVLGCESWLVAEAAGRIRASGTRSDLSEFFPLFTQGALDRWVG